MKKYTDSDDLQLISEAALESSLAGFWDWNMVSNEEYLSPRFKEMFGYKDHEMENSPEAWQKIAFPEDLPKMFEAFQKHIESKGRIPFHSIVRYRHKNGKTVWVRCNGKVVAWSKENLPLRSVGCHVDITEDKELEIELKKTLVEKNVLLSEVHHRVKNNLQMILSLSRLKEKDNQIDLYEIEDTIGAIASAHEAIYKSDRFDKINLEKYLLRIIGPISSRHNAQFEITSDTINEKIDFLIPIGLIITECLNNSIKHGYPESKTKKSVTLLIKKNKEHITITYNDNGCGYENSALKSNGKLNSFGITLMNALAKQINGKIEFSNSNGGQMKLTIINNSNKA